LLHFNVAARNDTQLNAGPPIACAVNKFRARELNRHIHSREDTSMNEDRIAGTTRNLGGKVQEGFGRVTGDTKTQAEGLVNQATGAAQDLYGQAKDTAADAAQVVRRSAADAEDFVRRTIEERPYTTAFMALCIGWVIGRMGRRD
jgi:uncharacterized protein YjbJ (UPF0337 family)